MAIIPGQFDDFEEEIEEADAAFCSKEKDLKLEPPFSRNSFQYDLESDECLRFFTAKPISSSEVEAVGDIIHQRMNKLLDKLTDNAGGDEKAIYAAYLKLLEEQKTSTISDEERICANDPSHVAGPNLSAEEAEEALEAAAIGGSPRDYQTALYEIAKRRNTIVHLGTGKGKTLIALLVIRHFAQGVFDVEGNTKQTLFVVPSVALALQQTATLRANLPFSVATACGVTQQQSLVFSKQANILVATHGAIHDLLMHYGDIFTMSTFNLVVFDECHYASGSHQYKLIMDKWYHTLPIEKRPRILGLTASPLMNIKHVHSDEHLANLLQALEETLDSRLATVRTNSPSLNSPLTLMNHDAEELAIYYDAEPNMKNKNASFPTHDHLQIHSSRKRELNQLRILYDDLGPLAVSIYCQSVLNEVSCNVYEKESAGQFHILASHFQRIISFCRSQISLCLRGGRSDKLLKLELLLQEQVQKSGSEGKGAVGLVFVQRRITAMALYSYFDSEHTLVKQNVSFDDLPKFTWNDLPAAKNKNSIEIGPVKKTSLPNYSSSQFDDADGDHVHFRLRTREKQATPYDSCSDYNNPDQSSEYSQFEDADDDTDLQVEKSKDKPVENTSFDEGILCDQFEDANDDDMIDLLEGISNCGITKENEEKRVSIRCGVLVRQATHIFKYLNAANRNLAIYKAEPTNGDKGDRENEDSALPWLHQEVKIDETLASLRRQEINVLLATSIVEEGVDVQACSFVICFDPVASTKTYIQMKGRARQKNAKFFLFQNNKDNSVLMTLQKAEQRILMFIEHRQDMDISDVKIDKPFLKDSTNEGDSENGITNQSSYFELKALRDGYYREALHGSVDLTSAKSLLNRYVLNIPVENNVRATKDAFLLHMPTYGDYELVLPAHLPADVRVVTLPEQYRQETNKNERQKMLALMACVRLHQFKLLNERLLPLSKKDLCSELVGFAKSQVSKVSPKTYNIKSLFDQGKMKAYLYPILQRGGKFEEFLNVLKSEKRSLALIMYTPIELKIDPMIYHHCDLGQLHAELGEMSPLVLTESELDLITNFFSVVMSARWRRKSKNEWFRTRDKGENRLDVLPVYAVGLLNGQGKVDWSYMQQILDEFRRSPEERKEVVKSYCTASEMKSPRLCQPIYNVNAQYIVLGPTEKDCRSVFPDQDEEGIHTFQDYYRVKKDVELSDDDVLFVAQRPFGMPARYIDHNGKVPEKATILIPRTIDSEFEEYDFELLSGLAAVHLPQSVCQESEMPDPSLLLLSVALPQILYNVERRMVADAFIRHCKINFPCLGNYLKDIPVSELHIGMTAKATNITDNYDKYEWFGDGVLKLLQTDTLLNAHELRCWVQCLHEGDLTHLRSAMTNNAYLAAACQKVGFSNFVMDTPLARGRWMPQILELYSQNEEGLVITQGDSSPGVKSCADIMESILGLIYIYFGYKAATDVGVECGILLPQGNEVVELSYAKNIPPERALQAVQVLTGRTHFNSPGLIEEAFTHPSAVHEAVPSYQRLEWVGDAVLCLAMREWIFRTFPHLSVGDMVTLDAAMVSNEVLGYQCFKSTLHTFINHRQQSLPTRIERYKWSVGEDVGRGIWGSDPPKILSDVVEAVLGAVHIDGGFDAGKTAVQTMMRPLMDAVESANGDATVFRHPITILNEIGGRMFDFEIVREDAFLRDHGRDMKAWHGTGWRQPCVDGRETVGSVLSTGQNLISVLEPSMKSARNRACALAVAVLEDNDELSQRWAEVSTIIERQCTLAITKESNGIASDDDDDLDVIFYE